MTVSISRATRARIWLSILVDCLMYTFAIAASGALIWLAQDALKWCYGSWGGCGTPCASASIELMAAPVVLVAPFVRLLWAKGLPWLGLVARCAVTSGIGVWLVAMGLIWKTGMLF